MGGVLYLIRSQQMSSESIVLGGSFRRRRNTVFFFVVRYRAPFMLSILSCTEYSLFLLCNVKQTICMYSVYTYYSCSHN